MMNRLKTLFIVALAFTALTYATERVYLAPFSTVGIDKDLGITTEKLMHAYIDENGRYVLVNYAEDDSVKVGDYESINKVAIQKNCSKFIMAEFTRLGQSVVTSFKLYNVNNEKPVWSDRLKAANPDDFDPIIERVARNIGSKRLTTDDDDIYTVTEQETIKPRKKGISGYFGLNIIGDLELTPNTNMLAGIGLFALFDAKKIFFGLDFTLTNMGDELNKPTFYDFSLSVYYPFGSSNNTPFVGGGLSYSWHITFDDNDELPYTAEELSTNGLTGFVGGGILLNRASSVAFLLQAKYFIDFFNTPYVEETSSKKYKKTNKHIQGLKFSIGIGF
ncbi:hypothetical protein [Fibrobacter sp. UWB11]|uniref:hypothetical protein n=1 Tax=Fibrobacter sp. UWB11 TaxID=1896202 RepID=UPI00092976C4|nr:hypothetical protein [Fibrobacter sp. UWB11]SIO01740.1 hypothetical protein SAMN05720758_1031 [Fibrobacter sp. UWB11]